MLRGQVILRLNAAMLFWCILNCDLAMASDVTVKVWTRGTGNYFKSEGKEKNIRIVAISSLKQHTLAKFDIQLGKKFSFKGVKLADVISSYDADPSADMALLHFSNRMIVPVPLTNQRAALSKLDALIATQIQIDKKWTSSIPKIEREEEAIDKRDPVPTTFSGNKIVVSTLWYPFASEEKALEVPNQQNKKLFSPWRNVGSITGVEFVNQDAYYAQFAVKGEDEGFKVFFERCQYCHGVNGVGAKYGWDYVDPLPLFEKRNAKQLFIHVKYPSFDTFRLRQRMPKQQDFSQVESEAMWKWLKAVTKSDLKPYQIP